MSKDQHGSAFIRSLFLRPAEQFLMDHLSGQNYHMIKIENLISVKDNAQVLTKLHYSKKISFSL